MYSTHVHVRMYVTLLSLMSADWPGNARLVGKVTKGAFLSSSFRFAPTGDMLGKNPDSSNPGESMKLLFLDTTDNCHNFE